MGARAIHSFFHSHSIRYDKRNIGVPRLETEQEPDEKWEKFESVKEYFDFLLPQALMYGMTPDQFWHDEAELFWAYRTSFLLKRQNELDNTNYSSWLNGLYMISAIATALGSTRKDGSKVSYFEKPIDLYAKSEHDIIKKSEKDIIAENERNIKFMVAQSQVALMKKKKKEK
jgi:hypothetical protein